MSTFIEKARNFLNTKHRRFVCSSELVQQTKKQVADSDDTFYHVYYETRNLANSILEKLEEHRKKVKALCVALDAASDAIVVIDAEGFIVYANDQFLKLYKYVASEIVGSNMNILRTEYTTDDFYRNMWRTIKSNSYWEGILVNKAKDGEQFTVLSKILPIMNGKPEPIYYVCTQNRNLN